MFLLRLFKVTDVLSLLLLGLLRFELIDVTNERVHSLSVLALEFLSLFQNRCQIAIEEVKARESIPRIEHFALEDHNFMVFHHLAQLLLLQLSLLQASRVLAGQGRRCLVFLMNGRSHGREEAVLRDEVQCICWEHAARLNPIDTIAALDHG